MNVQRVVPLATFWSRFKGLMLKKTIDRETLYILTPCNGIHMLFMRFPIDVVYLDAEGKVLRVIEGLKPWRLGPVIREARYVLEFQNEEWVEEFRIMEKFPINNAIQGDASLISS